LKVLGSGESVQDDQLAEQKKQPRELQQIKTRARNARQVFANRVVLVSIGSTMNRHRLARP
jgi:hypothetical protein